MSEKIEDRELTSLPPENPPPTKEEIIEEQKDATILEVKADEELEEVIEPTQIFKKPTSKPAKKKKQLSERQRAHLEKMRQRKAEKAKNKTKSKSKPPKPAKKNQPEIPQNSYMPTSAPIPQPPQNNFNFDTFLGNVDKMINVLNKYQRPQSQTMPTPAPTPKPPKIPKKVIKKAPQKPIYNVNDTLSFINRSVYDNFRRPFE